MRILYLVLYIIIKANTYNGIQRKHETYFFQDEADCDVKEGGMVTCRHLARVSLT